MRRSFFAVVSFVACFQATMAIAQSTAPGSSTAEALAVLTELSERSAIPREEIVAVVQDCDANQMSMNFCAWRDQISAERELDRVVADKIARRPECRGALETYLATRRRDFASGCERSADAEYGEGSIKPMMRAMCMQAEIAETTKQVARMKGCRPK